MPNLLKLMKKEWIFFKGTMRMQLIIAVLFVTVFPLISPQFIGMGSAIVPYFALYGAMAYEEKSKGDILMATLPVSRKEICFSKYILGMIYNVVGALVSSGFAWIGKIIMPDTVSSGFGMKAGGEVLILMIGVGMIYIAIMLPVLFKFGTEKSRYIMLLLYMTIFALAGVFDGVTQSLNISSLTQTVHGALISVVVIGIILYILSIGLSIKILEKKEF